jgi:hypothetical protein
MKRFMLALLACAVSSLAAAGKPVPTPAGDFAVREQSLRVGLILFAASCAAC